MAFASSSTCFDIGDGSILGCFHEKEHGRLFEYSRAKDGDIVDSWRAKDHPEFPHRVWVNELLEHGRGFRLAKVMKTVAYVLLDGDEISDAPIPYVEKWYIKGHKEYNKLEERCFDRPTYHSTNRDRLRTEG